MHFKDAIIILKFLRTIISYGTIILNTDKHKRNYLSHFSHINLICLWNHKTIHHNANVEFALGASKAQISCE